jgi:UrcA family protein
METKTGKAGRAVVTAVFAVAALGLTVGTAGAGETGIETASKVVHYSDLNLATFSGARALLGRIESAAKDVCGDRSTRDLAVQAQEKSCYQRAVSDAVQTVSNPMLTAVYEKKAPAQFASR